MSSQEEIQDVIFPDLCRSCNEKPRVKGWFKCPWCVPQVDPVAGLYTLTRKETYDDYPDAAVENARMALEAKEDTGNPNDCGTQVGWERANQLDNRENLSVNTISRMAAFARHEDNYDPDASREDCGWLMWKAWGGTEGIEWAERKLDEIEKTLKSYPSWKLNGGTLVNQETGEEISKMHPPSPKIEIDQKQDGQWTEYTGPNGGEGWQNIESGEIVYQNEPPGNVVEMTVNEVGEALVDEIGAKQTNDLFDEVDSPKAVFDYYDVVSGTNEEFVDLEMDDFTLGQTVWNPKTGTQEIVEVVRDPAVTRGPDAGYLLLEDETVVNLMGEVPDELEGDVDESEILSISELQGVNEIEEATPDAVDIIESIDYDKASYESLKFTDGVAKTLFPAEKDKFWNQLGRVHEEATNELKQITREAKKSSYSNEGKYREKAFLEAVGRRDSLPVRNTNLVSEEPSNELVAVTDKMIEASQQAFQEEFGDEGTVHRGISDEAFEQLIEELISNGSEDSVSFQSFGMTNYSTVNSTADKFAEQRKTATLSIDISPDDVLSWTDFLMDDIQEGEISILGGERDISIDDISLPWSEKSLEEELEDPSPDFESMLQDMGLLEEVAQ